MLRYPGAAAVRSARYSGTAHGVLLQTNFTFYLGARLVSLALLRAEDRSVRPAVRRQGVAGVASMLRAVPSGGRSV